MPASQYMLCLRSCPQHITFIASVARRCSACMLGASEGYSASVLVLAIPCILQKHIPSDGE